MTEQMAATVKAEGGAVRKGKTALWWAAGAALAVAVAGWIALGALILTGADKPVLLAAAVVGALGTEATVWITAAALGLTVFEARKRIWAKVTGRSR